MSQTEGEEIQQFKNKRDHRKITRVSESKLLVIQFLKLEAIKCRSFAGLAKISSQSVVLIET